MKTKEQVLSAIKDESLKSECIDGRDFSRLADFFDVSDWPALGFSLKDGAETPTPTAWTHENIIKQLQSDVAFGFEKALNRRGISSSFMYETVKMWMWVLEDELKDFDDYPMYGLPLFKAVAIKYGFDNPIGDDIGSEHKYGC